MSKEIEILTLGEQIPTGYFYGEDTYIKVLKDNKDLTIKIRELVHNAIEDLLSKAADLAGAQENLYYATKILRFKDALNYLLSYNSNLYYSIIRLSPVFISIDHNDDEFDRINIVKEVLSDDLNNWIKALQNTYSTNDNLEKIANLILNANPPLK